MRLFSNHHNIMKTYDYLNYISLDGTQEHCGLV